MKKFLFAMLAAASIFMAGCRVVEVESRGEGIVTDKEGTPVLLNGAVQKYSKGWNVYHNQHWMWTNLDSMEAHIKPDDISFSMGKLSTAPSTNLTALVDTSLTGLANLATKVGAAIATCGGTAGADATSAAIATLINKFTASGGNVDSATVTTSGNDITITDGTVSTSATCSDGTCTIK